jgi:hypothetical protein
VVVHGDVEGVDGVRRGLTDWLSWMNLIPAGGSGSVGRYVGFYEPYATSHQALDADTGFQEEVRNAARSLVNLVRQIRKGTAVPPDQNLRDPRPKQRGRDTLAGGPGMLRMRTDDREESAPPGLGRTARSGSGWHPERLGMTAERLGMTGASCASRACRVRCRARS